MELENDDALGVGDNRRPSRLWDLITRVGWSKYLPHKLQGCYAEYGGHDDSLVTETTYILRRTFTSGQR